MRSFVVDTTSGRLELGVTSSVLPHDEVVVRVEWSGVNFKDSMVASEPSRVRRLPRIIGGVDAAGVIESSTNSDMPVGTRVAVHGGDLGVARDGGFAEYVAVPARFISVLPDAVSTRDAMILGTAGFTAFASLSALEHHGLAADGEVLVTGATGGVGSWAVAALASAGYSVTASTGSRDVHEFLNSLGATRIIGRDDIADKPDRVLASERWAGAIDCVGGTTLHEILRSLRYGAAVAASGLVGSAELATNVYPFITRSVALLGIDAVEASTTTRTHTWKRFANARSRIDVEALVDSTISLDGVADALEVIREGKTRGRILVQVAG
jgi:putative YhdH/YhfP family quinone oxidoreductase